MRTVGIAALTLFLVSTAASCGSPEEKGAADASSQDKHGAPSVDCGCGDVPGDVRYEGSVRVTFNYQGSVPLHDIAVSLHHGGNGCEDFAPASPWQSQGLGEETVVDISQGPLWDGVKPGNGYMIYGTARGPGGELAAWGCLDSIEVLDGDAGATEVTLELHGFVSPANSACTDLAQNQCEASPQCDPFLAWSKEAACAGEPAEAPAFVGCGSSDHVCSVSWTWACPEDKPKECRMFVNSCIPTGWKVGEDRSNICAVDCEGLAMPDCESTPPCMAVFGAPLEAGCSWGEEEYAGCRTGGEFDEHGGLMGYPCATEPMWGHPGGAPEKWYEFELSCVPDGWFSAEEPPCQ